MYIIVKGFNPQNWENRIYFCMIILSFGVHIQIVVINHKKKSYINKK